MEIVSYNTDYVYIIVFLLSFYTIIKIHMDMKKKEYSTRYYTILFGICFVLCVFSILQLNNIYISSFYIERFTCDTNAIMDTNMDMDYTTECGKCYSYKPFKQYEYKKKELREFANNCHQCATKKPITKKRNFTVKEVKQVKQVKDDVMNSPNKKGRFLVKDLMK